MTPRGSDPPEPCLDEKCRTPIACEEFGYCRWRAKLDERKITNHDVMLWRRNAVERRKHREREQGR